MCSANWVWNKDENSLYTNVFKENTMQKNWISRSLALVGGALLSTALMAKPPNILVIMSDDVGWQNVSAYSHGVMGYDTPNIDRIAKEGVMFTDHYA